jgi:hypothetical protein
MKNDVFAVITTIHAPSPAVAGLGRLLPDRLIVVGDRKTPPDWSHPGVEYLGPDAQQQTPGALAASLPWNHYSRKMLGYLRAVRRGAQVIYDTDDDNRPKADWEIAAFEGTFSTTRDGLGFVNIYGCFSDKKIWPRGFPLSSIRSPESRVRDADLSPRPVRVGVWQALADGDPDVDAIYRLVDGELCFFADRPPVVLGVGSACPFNSQATAVRRELFPLLYLPATVSFRFTDILRGLVAQPILWAAGYHVGFTRATVVQDRNPHDYLEDFASEVPFYLHARDVLDIAAAAVRPDTSVSQNLVSAYEALGRRGLVDASESALVSAWLSDLASSEPPA